MSIATAPNSQSERPESGKALQGLTVGWFGPFDAFCDQMGLSRAVRRDLEKSLDGDEGFICINNQNVLVTAEAGWRHLRKLASGGDDGVAVPRPAPKGKTR